MVNTSMGTIFAWNADHTAVTPVHDGWIYSYAMEGKMSFRLERVLDNAGVKYISDILKYTEKEVKGLPRVGVKMLAELKEFLASQGLHLGMGTYTCMCAYTETNTDPPSTFRKRSNYTVEVSRINPHWDVLNKHKEVVYTGGVEDCQMFWNKIPE